MRSNRSESLGEFRDINTDAAVIGVHIVLYNWPT